MFLVLGWIYLAGEGVGREGVDGGMHGGLVFGADLLSRPHGSWRVADLFVRAWLGGVDRYGLE